MSNITTFNFNNLPVRTQTDDSAEFWFCATDVCDILGYTNPNKAITDHCKDGGITKRYTVDSLGRKQELSFINEPNLYRLIIKSRKPEAEKFEQWVMEDVLPTIRKNGNYMSPAATKALRYEEKKNILLTQQEVIELAYMYAKVDKMTETLAILEKPLAAIGSNYAGHCFDARTLHRKEVEDVKTIMCKLFLQADINPDATDNVCDALFIKDICKKLFVR